MAELSELYARIFGYIGPPFPGLPDKGLNNPDSRVDVPGAVQSVFNTMKGSTPLGRKEIMSVSLRHPDVNNGEWWKFPYQPLVALETGNRIIRRFPADSGMVRGSIKESWNRDDARITLEGVMMYQAANVRQEKYRDRLAPDLQKEIRTLSEFENAVVVEVENPKINMLGFNALAIDRLRWPAYSHHLVHPFRITAYSDDSNYKLLE